MPAYRDQIGGIIIINTTPIKIISLVPSITELLFDMGLENEVVGITKFCVHPQQWFKNKTKVGGTKNVHIDIVKKLMPDLIIANKEENIKEQIEKLEKIAPVWVSDVNNYDNALQMIAAIGEITSRKIQAEKITSKINECFNQLPALVCRNAVYLIWKEPYMTIGGDTFINDMLSKAGFRNLFANQSRYPIISIEDIKQLHPDIILLSSEPYPFKEKHLKELSTIFPKIKIALADGEIFSWYGSHMQYAADYFLQLQQQISDRPAIS